MNEDELKRILTTKDIDIAVGHRKLDDFLKEIQKRKYLISSLFYVYYPDILSVIFGADDRTKQTCWLRHYPPVTSLLQPIRDEKAPNGSFFRVLFMYTSFPPKFDLSLSALPRPSQRDIRTMLATGGAATYIPSLYKSGGIRQRSAQPTVELSIFEFFFYAFAQYPVNAPAPPIPKANATPAYLTLHSGTLVTADHAFGHLLQAYLPHFLPRSGLRSEQGDALLSVLTEFWLNVNSYPNHEFPEELIVPCVTHLVSVRRLLAYLLSDPAAMTSSQQTMIAAAGSSLSTAHTTMGLSTSAAIPTGLTNDVAKLQRNLFHFVRTSLLSWPQTWNESFSQMVRVWLSYMQPWRASREHERLQIRITVDPTTNQSYVAPPAAPAWGAKPIPESNFDSRWSGYVLSNLPFYTTLMLDFMLLIQEFDFANSITCVSLLHQVLSVYTDELLTQVRQFERVVVARSAPSNNAQSQILQNQLTDLLGVTPSEYMPLCPSVLTEVEDNILGVTPVDNDWVRGRHRGAAGATPARTPAAGAVGMAMMNNGFMTPGRDREMERKELQADMPPSAHSLATAVLAILQNRSYSLRRADGTPAGPDDMAMYADTELKLRRIFHLTEASAPSHASLPDQAQLSQRARPNLSPERDSSDPFGRLTKRGKQAVREGRSVCSNLDVPYIGDVWSRPVCSYESIWALRALRPLAHRLNITFKRAPPSAAATTSAIAGPGATAIVPTTPPWTFDAPVRRMASLYFIISFIMLFLFIVFIIRIW